MPDSLIRPFYDAEASRIEVSHIPLQHSDGGTTRIVALEVFNPGLDPLLVQMEEGEAEAFAEAILAGFPHDDEKDA